MDLNRALKEVSRSLRHNRWATALSALTVSASVAILITAVFHIWWLNASILAGLILFGTACIWCYRSGYFDKIQQDEVYRTLDKLAGTKERSTSYEELLEKESQLDASRKALLEKQLDQELSRFSGSLEIRREIDRPLWIGLRLAPLLWICSGMLFFFSDHLIPPPVRSHSAAAIEELLEKEQYLPRDVREELSSFAEQLADDSVSGEEIEAALESAAEELKQAEQELERQDLQSKENEDIQEQEEEPKREEEQRQDQGPGEKSQKTGQGKSGDSNQDDKGRGNEGQGEEGAGQGEGKSQQGTARDQQGASQKNQDGGNHSEQKQAVKNAKDLLSKVQKDLEHDQQRSKSEQANQRNQGQKSEKGGQKDQHGQGEQGESQQRKGNNSEQAGTGKEPSKDEEQPSESDPSKSGSQRSSADNEKSQNQPPSGEGKQGKQDSSQQNSRENEASQSSQAKPGERNPNQQQGSGHKGLGERKGFEEKLIQNKDEQFDTRYTSENGELVKNTADARAKTELADTDLVRPEPVRDRSEQSIPLEYRELLK